MSRPDGWDWDISDYTDSHTGQTLYRVSVHDCRQPAAGNLSGFPSSDAAEAGARKWIAEKMGKGEPPTPVLRKDATARQRQAMQLVSVIAQLKATMNGLPEPPADHYGSHETWMRASDVYFWRWDRLLSVLHSIEKETAMLHQKHAK